MTQSEKLFLNFYFILSQIRYWFFLDLPINLLSLSLTSFESWDLLTNNQCGEDQLDAKNRNDAHLESGHILFKFPFSGCLLQFYKHCQRAQRGIGVLWNDVISLNKTEYHLTQIQWYSYYLKLLYYETCVIQDNYVFANVNNVYMFFIYVITVIIIKQLCSRGHGL